MRSETIPRGGCRFIAGDPRDIHTKGGSIFCGKPVTHKGGVWCAEHERVTAASRLADYRCG